MRRGLAVVLLATGTLRADGWTYRYTTHTEGGYAPSVRTGAAWIDGARARLEVASDSGRGATLHDATRASCTYLDLVRKTYVGGACPKEFVAVGGLSPRFGIGGVVGPGAAPAEPRRDRLTFEEKDIGPGPVISGFATRGTLFTVAWREQARIGPETVSLELSRTIEIWSSDRIAQLAFVFGHDDQLAVVPNEVRPRLARRLSELGYPLKLVVTSRRKFDRGEPATETRTTILEDVRTTSIDPSLFEIPKDFRHEEPRVGLPSQ